MVDSIGNVGAFAVAGILLAILIIGGFAVAGFKIPALKFPALLSGKGTLTVQITDKPAELKHLNLTIDKLSIHKAGDGDDSWINMDLIGGEPKYFDLLALKDVALTLSRAEIPAGNYTMIKMHVLTANATYNDGQTTPLDKVPSENMKIILQPHLIMEEDGAMTVTIDLEPDTAKIAISQSLNLKPTIKAMGNG